MKRDQRQWAIDVPFRDVYFVIGSPFNLLRFGVLKKLVLLMLGRYREPEPPGHPYADKLAPIRTGPKVRSGAAVMDEPEDDINTDAFSRR
jgi:hypothetical protein